MSSIYGIELLTDNAITCRERLFTIFADEYRTLYGDRIKQECLKSIRFLLSKNIIIGDALSYHRVDKPEEWIVVSEWSLIGSGMMNRRDYQFSYLVAANHGNDLFSDEPCRTFDPVYFLNLNAEQYGE